MLPPRCLVVWLVFVSAIFAYYFTLLLVYTNVPFSELSIFEVRSAAGAVSSSSSGPSVGDDASWLANNDDGSGGGGAGRAQANIPGMSWLFMSMGNINTNNFDRCAERNETTRRQQLHPTTPEALAAATDNNLTTDYIQLPRHSDDYVYVNTFDNQTIYVYSAFSVMIHSTGDRSSAQQPLSSPQQLPSRRYKILALVDQDKHCPSRLFSIWQTLANLFSFGGAQHEYYCRIESNPVGQSSKKITELVPAQLECLPEGHGHQYLAAIFHCQRDLNMSRVRMPWWDIDETIALEHRLIDSTNGSIVSNGVSDPIAVISKSINGKDPDNNNKEFSTTTTSVDDLTICVRPFFGAINLLNLLEFVAYYRANKARNFHFFYYNLSRPSRRLEQVLQYLKTLPGAILTPLSVPTYLHANVHAGGQILAMHHCLFAHPDSVQVHLDIDEYIQLGGADDHPTHQLLLGDYIGAQLNQTKGVAALYIRNRFHCHEFNLRTSQYYEFRPPPPPPPTTTSANKTTSTSLVANIIETYLAHVDAANIERAMLVKNNFFSQRSAWPTRRRSKVIILRPQMIEVMGIHFVWRFAQRPWAVLRGPGPLVNVNYLAPDISPSVDSYPWRDVPPEVATLHHYRWCCRITQTYFFNLLEFYTVDDVNLRGLRIHADSGSLELLAAVVKAKLEANQQRAPFFDNIGTFMLQHYRRFATNVERNA